MNPGSNVLLEAFAAVDPQSIQYLAFQGRAQSASYRYVSEYSDPVPILASVQMVPRSMYLQYGLNVQKRYIKVFAAIDAVDVQRDTSSDRFIWSGGLYQIDSNNDWFVQDGWMSCIAIYLKAYQ